MPLAIPRALLALLCLVLAPSLALAQAAPRGATLARAIERARARVDSAARQGDATALAAQFDDDAHLVTPRGDTLRGRAAIAEWLGGAPLASASTRFTTINGVRECRDGAWEWGDVRVVRVRRDAAPDTVTGYYAARWRADAAGDLHLRWASLSSRPFTHFRPSRADCAAPVERVAGARRVELRVEPLGLLASRNAMADAVEEAMSARGWNDLSLDDKRTPRSDNGPAGGFGTTAQLELVVRPRAPFSVAAFVITDRSGTTHGRDASVPANITFTYRPMVAGLLAGWDWRFLRVGAGPALLSTSWSMREDYGGQQPVERWTSRTAGVAAHVSATFALGGRLLGTASASWHQFPSTETHGTPRFAPVTVPQRAVRAGIGLGWAL